MKDPFLLTVIFVFAVCFGSFFNVLIYRLPRGQSLLRPPSHCPRCNAKIRFYDNLPILSFLILKGKCRHCGQPISWCYPLVEFLTGALAVVSFYYFGLNIRGFEAAFLSMIFVPIFFIDLDFRIIPDLFTLPGIVLGLAVSFIPGALINWQQALIGMIVGGGTFYLVGALGQLVFRKEALGFGDVKLAAMMGAFLGWQNLVLILVVASFLGSVIGIALIIARGREKTIYVPFGPFLVAAALISLYYGNIIITAYKNYFLH